MVASQIRELRESLGLSMPEFGRKLGCSRDVIANIEYGRVEPKEVFLSHICDIYGVNRQWLLTGTGSMLDERAGDDKVREAAEIFRFLSPDLQELALSQLKGLQKLMNKRPAVTSGGARDDLDTVRLMAAMLEAQDFGEIREKSRDGSTAICGQLRELMAENRLSLEQLSALSAVNEQELSRMLEPGAPVRRDALIAVGIALSLDVEEVQRLLTAAGQPSLYAKNRRDSACMFALMKGLSVGELNDLLMGLEDRPLTGRP